MVIDGDMQRLPACALRVLCAVAGDAVAGLVELAELFRVEVQQLAGRLARSAARAWWPAAEGSRDTPAALHARATVLLPRPTRSAVPDAFDFFHKVCSTFGRH